MEGAALAPEGAFVKWHLQIVRTVWVLWGYGPRTEGARSMHCDRAVLKLEGFCELPFELPASTGGEPLPQEHERRVGYGWRWNHEDGAGHSWRFAESFAECVATAARSMTHQRRDTQRIFAEAIKDVRVVDELDLLTLTGLNNNSSAP